MRSIVALALLTIAAAGCSTGEKERVYDYNTFYATQPKPEDRPSKGRRNQVDLFNKTCERTGNTNDHGREYECHYSDD